MSDDRFDPWRTLGVPVGAGPGDIRRAWRKLARRMHPDVRRHDAAHDDFVRLRQAYETLIDDELRARLEHQALSADVPDLVIIADFEVSLGDAYELLDRGYLDEARDLYLELARDHAGDPRLLELLDALRRAEHRAVAVEVGARPVPHPPTARPAAESYREIWRPAPTPVRWWLPALGLALAAGGVALARTSTAAPVLAGYSAPVLGLAALGGFLGTALVVAGGLLRSFDFELGEAIGDSAGSAPVWLYLGVAGLISPALALAFYLVAVALQIPLSWRVLGFFALTCGLAAALSWPIGAGWLVWLTVGWSAVFVPGLLGWAAGSAFRPGHWWE